jgi:hypothetical protein
MAGGLSCPAPPIISTIRCTYSGAVAPGDTLKIAIPVIIAGSPSPTPSPIPANQATVSSGGVPSATTSATATAIALAADPFGIASFLAVPSTVQAGAHPDFTTAFTFNTKAAHDPVSDPRDIVVALPPGLLGDPLAVPRCNTYSVDRLSCPEDTAIGVATATTEGGNDFVQLVYNITPYPGEPAAFMFQIGEGLAKVRLDTRLIPLQRPGGEREYAVQVTVPEINESEPIVSSTVTLWGTPADNNGPGPDITDEERIINGGRTTFGGFSDEAENAKPFMRNPTTCPASESLAVGVEADSWPEPGTLDASGVVDLDGPSGLNWRPASSPLPTLSGCSLLSSLFDPSIETHPETEQAGAPAGYNINLDVPQNENPEAFATPDLKDATVTLPSGVVASPSAANGLEACSDAQFEQSSTSPAVCSHQSQIGTVKVKTPLLEEALEGQVFLGEPECSPCGPSEAGEGKLVRLFLQIQYESGEYVRVKLAGRTKINQQTGQLTTEFLNNPQLPFEVLSLDLKGGEDAPLANPSTCGVATTTAQLTPWSAERNEPPAEPSSGFQVQGCAVTRFSPSFAAGMTASAQAGAYSPFAVTFSRTDQDQPLGGISVQTPPGLLGDVSHVGLCGEAQANMGICGPETQIGEAAVAIGPGSAPYWVRGAKVYLTEKYGNYPFGLSIVAPAEAGPFRLAGNTGTGAEVVRAGVSIDPHTTALTVSSGQLPTELDGIPLQIKTISVNINRPEFTFNATNCEANLSIDTTITSSQGGSANASSPYRPANCASLPFKPTFTVSTQGKTSRADGASLDVKVAERPDEANIHKVDVQLPVSLPARLTTLQKACTEAQFNTNPAGCPPASDVGVATARTPVLKVPLTGPAYLVSHGGAAFPDLVIVLQADERGGNLSIDLVGNTDIKKGITYSKFETVPDAPVSSFELSLPEGPHSALAANAGLCGQSLVMPTTIVGQNGAQVEQQTTISVTGCPKPAVKILKARLKRNALLVTVETSTAGTVTVTGKGLKTLKKSLGAGSHQLKLALTKSGRSLRARHKRDKLKATLRSLGASAVSKTKVLRF